MALIDWHRIERAYKSVMDWVLRPFIVLCNREGVTPSHISYARLFLGLLGLFMIWLGKTMPGAGVFLVALVLDSIDGGLARLQRCASHRGTFLDRVCDYTLYCASVLAALAFGHVGALASAYHIYIVFAAVVLTIIHRQEGRKSDWIINPTANLVWFMIAWYASFFAWIFFDVYFMDNMIFWLNAILTLVAVQAFWAIQQPKRRK